jgi:peptide-methionine (R)-S-oxide reductase
MEAIMVEFHKGRRAFLGATAGAGALALAGGRAAAGGGQAAYDAGEDSFAYEVQLGEEEWRERLTEEEFVVLRNRFTEIPKTSDLWDNTAEGIYCCRGCGLPLYDSVWKVELDIGYAFFRMGRENALLMGIDGEPPYGDTSMATEDSPFGPLIETRCRRCGSHMGHILLVRGDVLHCINGTALTFEPATA